MFLLLPNLQSVQWGIYSCSCTVATVNAPLHFMARCNLHAPNEPPK